MTRQKLLETAKSLSKEDRIELAMDLWETINAEADDLALTDAQKQELDRRIDEELANPSPDEDWETVRDQILRGEI